MSLLQIFLFLDLFIIISTNQNNPFVSLKNGKLHGKLVNAPERQITCQAYLGVPFAEPPLGDLRFKPPRPAKSWKGTREVNGPYNICASMPWGKEYPNESEDCLYLHIVTAEKFAKDDFRPVIVWIHGGGFIAARSSFTPEIACQNFASRGVVLVSIQYRVGYLGFLSSGDDEAKGNYGLHDQLAAVKWINENIAQFGGDPQRVTIWGSSAGGASASFLSYIPAAENYVHRTISQSGSPFAFWAFNHRSVASFPRFVKAAGCHSKNNKDILECLRKKTLKELQDAHMEEFGIESYARRKKEGVEYNGGGHDWPNIISFNWGPRMDGNLIPENPHKLIKRLKKPKTAITGVTERECLLFSKPWQFWPVLWEVTEKFRNITIPYYIENDDEFDIEHFYSFFDSALTIFENPADFHPEKSKKEPNKVLYDFAKAIYLNKEGKTASKEDEKIHHIEQMVNLCSDFWMNIPCMLDAETKQRRNWDVFVYNFDFIQDAYPEDYPEIWKGAVHDDITKLIWSSKTPNQIQMRELLLHLWTNFAKYAHPTPKPEQTGFDWPKFDSIKNPTNLRLNLKPEKDDKFHDPSVPFWTLFAPEIRKSERQKTEL